MGIGHFLFMIVYHGTTRPRAQGRPIVLTCDIDLERLRQRHGSGKVILNGNVISIKGEVPATALRSRIGLSNVPETPIEIARWINQVLGVKPHNGVRPRHVGIDRLANWVDHRLAANPHKYIGKKELLSRARQWLPEFFDGLDIDFEHQCVWRRMEVVPREDLDDEDAIAVDPREVEVA